MLFCLIYDISIGFCYTPVILVVLLIAITAGVVPNDIITTCIPRKYIVIFR